MGVSGQRHAPAALYPRGKDPGIHECGNNSERNLLIILIYN
jgi:hypothetical protein